MDEPWPVTWTNGKQRSPCKKCGGPKPGGCGRWYCVECAELVHWQTETREQARIARKRKPCKGCGGIKDPGKHVYCATCRAKRNAPYACRRCGEHKIPRGTHAHICAACKALEPTQNRAKWREQKQRARQDPARAERMRENTRRWRMKIAAEPLTLARVRESKRLQHRLRRLQATGQRPEDLRTQRPNGPVVMDRIGRLPAAPLARYLQVLVEHEAVESLDSARDIVCASAGISKRTLFAWEQGERTLVQFDLVDRVLTSLGLQWWDVYTEPEEYETARQVFETGANLRTRPAQTIEEYRAVRRAKRKAKKAA